MICWHGLVNKNFAWELTFAHKIRYFKDGISFLDLSISASWFLGDHQPSFGLHLIILNWTILEFRVYNIKHVEEIENK